MAAPRSRRRIVVRIAAAIVALLGVWAFLIEPRRLVVREATLTLPRWPAPLHGLRVAVLSDLHAGGWHVPESRVATIVARVNDLHPDLILLLGDFASTARIGGVAYPDRFAPLLGHLHAPLGTYAVLGNHDWWTDAPAIRRALESSGIPVLDQRAVPIEWRGARFYLAGIGDFMTSDSNPLRPLLAGAVPRDATLLYMTHNPDVFPLVGDQAALTIAGHTHGGQVKFPILGAPIVPSLYGQRYASGHVMEEGRHLFVTTGIGTSNLPVRFRVPPEIALLTLE